MIGAWKTIGWQDLASEGAEAALHAVADDCAADLLGHGEADADRRIGVLAIPYEQDEAGRRRTPAAVGGQEVSPFTERD
ncbi:hypothetical protein ACUXST_000407 [Sphingomonas sp. F9_3S_D5_B_2]|jgi:hypothetical protein